ncbi:hypothetical protein B2G71_18330 [Novosphingobium sp. PC22D]|uniref:phosphotransferase n=1 Tax=Novosphingobium sp. PC22D TaxID=1962403 RepID=UPI000BF1372E|nr:phosphotransferase [Novosphingobium sp. PC22D]PEQ11242.1 hypothetical protein B2G71_18330 [Novosphingobium sp. PC22D]
MPDPSYLPLPVTVEEITPEWVSAALRTRAEGAAVEGIEVVDAVFTTCSKIRLRLDRNPAAIAAGIPELVIVKGGFEEHGRRYYQMHEREVRGYRDVYPHVPLPHPRCFFAETDEERRQGIIIMEDLVAKGVEFCHATKPQSFEQMARRLTVLARFHAGTWESDAIRPGGRFGDFFDFFEVMQHFFDEKSSPENWARFCDLPRGVATSWRFRDRDWMVECWPKMMAYGKRQAQCLLHGDTHLGNLYIEPDGTPGFLDTLASIGAGMLEVSYHVSASVDVADRQAWEGELVRLYLAELERNGVAPPAFEDAMHQYAVFLLYGHFIWMTTESRYQPETVNTANMLRVCAAMLDHDTIGKFEAL